MEMNVLRVFIALEKCNELKKISARLFLELRQKKVVEIPDERISRVCPFLMSRWLGLGEVARHIVTNDPHINLR